MFRKILIANRGEIACRVIQTAHRLGVSAVAVHSDADARALHVEMADEAVHIGGSAPAESYLNAERIIRAALDTGAEAIHPGYGFLSENPDFVAAVNAAGLAFIGPSAEAIRAMGLKDAAKALMERAGVPVVPGYHGDSQADDHLSGAAEGIGYPVLIKAVAGGGGKGMRRVDTPAGFLDALASARAEALSAFGNPAVLIEKYIQTPRHIEVQVFGDGHRAVHLYERDCSLQRRHQKVIEEAPAPGMTPEMRAAMGAAATRAAEAIGYAGAGTVEFIVDAARGLRPDGFWFMEMNTRLQVEHPVTEAVTGIDLVEWQLRVASGERLLLAQEDIRLSGHAIEARLYAEDVPKGFLPATGRLAHLAFPEGARADSGVRTGDDINPFYDPMIAKLIVHGPTRAAALAQMDRALRQTEVAGTVTNLAFLGALVRHEGFRAGDLDTGLIERDLGALSAVAAPDAGTLGLAAVVALGLDGGLSPEAGFALWTPLWQRVVLRAGEESHEVLLSVLGPTRFRAETGGQAVTIDTANGWSIDGRRRETSARRIGDIVAIFGDCGAEFRVADPLDRVADVGAGSDMVEAPMPGVVKAVFVAAGDAVVQGQRLAILEAMKMEHALVASRDGVIAELLVAPGDLVQSGAPLVRFAGEDA
ncbi:MAG: biotin carboxylase N-terminal domain-containing protein [Paracoccaceae bacterium]